MIKKISKRWIIPALLVLLLIMGADLKEKSLGLLSSTASCDLDAANGTEKLLYTVPAGKTAIVTHVVIRTLSADASSAVVTFGVTGTADEWRGDQTLSALDGTTKYVVIDNDQGTNDTPEGGILFTTGVGFYMEITTKHGTAATATIDVFGYLF